MKAVLVLFLGLVALSMACYNTGSMCDLCYPNCKDWCIKHSLCCHTIGCRYNYYYYNNMISKYGDGYGFDLVPRKPAGFECPAEGVVHCGHHHSMMTYKECDSDDECNKDRTNHAKKMCCHDKCFGKRICVNAVPLFS